MTRYSQAFWIGYRYFLYKDDATRKNARVKRIVTDAYNSVTAVDGLNRRDALDGVEYAKAERERLSKLNLFRREPFNPNTLNAVERLLNEGRNTVEAAEMLECAQSTVSRYQAELVRLGRLKKREPKNWNELAREYGKKLRKEKR